MPFGSADSLEGDFENQLRIHHAHPPRAAGWRVGLGTRLLRGLAVIALAAALAAAIFSVRDHGAGAVTAARATLRAAPEET